MLSNYLRHSNIESTIFNSKIRWLNTSAPDLARRTQLSTNPHLVRSYIFATIHRQLERVQVSEVLYLSIADRNTKRNNSDEAYQIANLCIIIGDEKDADT